MGITAAVAAARCTLDQQQPEKLECSSVALAAGQVLQQLATPATPPQPAVFLLLLIRWKSQQHWRGSRGDNRGNAVPCGCVSTAGAAVRDNTQGRRVCRAGLGLRKAQQQQQQWPA